MHKPTDIGMNRTGIKMSPIDSKRVVESAHEFPASGIDGHVLEAERLRWARAAEPVGTVPPPGSVKGAVKAVLEKLEGHQPTVLIDKLGERLAFERTGTRLYDAILVKLAAASVHEGGPTRADLEEIRDAEHRHFTLVRDAMLQVGGDPTAVTPSADVMAVAAFGWVQAVSDPRTTLAQCLDVALAAELADTDGWELLVELAEALGFGDLAEPFREALAEEERHVLRVRNWLARSVLGQAGVSPTPPRP